jgi:group I intron endonuclease
MGALYRLDFPNGKSYVGITSGTAESRFRDHVRDAKHKPSGWAVHRAIRKYGADAVKVVTLAIADSWEYLQLIEKNAIRVFGTFGTKGYNMTAGGDGFLGGRHTPESKAKIAEAGRNISPETRKKIGDAFRGKPGSNLGCRHSARAKVEKADRQLARGTPQQGNTSGCAGVSWSRACGKWQARFKRFGEITHLGVFEKLEDAIAARRAATAEVLK